MTTRKYGRESGPTTVEFSILGLKDVKWKVTRLDLDGRAGAGRAPNIEGAGAESLPHVG